MNISGIRPGSGFYDYRVAQRSQLLSQQIQGAEAAETPKDIDSQNGKNNAQLNTGTRPEQSFNSLDYASQYQPDKTYEMKGRDSDIESLDMEQAINDMKKDQVIQQYQFFVGETQATQNINQNNRMMENFDF